MSQRDIRVRTVQGFTGTEWFEVLSLPGEHVIGSYWHSRRSWSAEHGPSGRTSRHRTPEAARDWVAEQW